ncbi:MAG: hypothetical protein A4E52_01446 [Pelotomaculum sp. PtaB.Bin013]|uniref:Uncharacterized protein n=1 Tax=Pelotomaculum isophthalicicum JI TaxID=947010 RepID=A0A9X4JWE3_9FIRM|nr:hypothetical protein [Pelotomaculum isophthalicicum]MDF9409057.1 hypothetical protein [Pelotomaculum isophthalicicum JI]OPX87020.1 MAG: hypothetical protein A4E52_01446 [Pelotomaculum sp. PtaB.Bin013]
MDKAIKNLMSSAETIFQLAAEVEMLADRTGQLNPSLTLEKAKLDFADSVKEAANCLEIPTLFKHVRASERKTFLKKEEVRLQILD